MPTQAEIDRVEAALESLDSKQDLNPRADTRFQDLGKFFGEEGGPLGRLAEEVKKNPRVAGRMALEAGAGITLAAPVPGGRPASVALRMMASAIGEAGGSIASESFDPSVNPVNTAEAAAVRGLFGQGGGEILTKVGGALLRPSQRLVPGAAKTTDIVSKGGGTITPGLISENRTLDLLEGIAEASFVGGGRIKGVRAEASDIVDRAARSFVDTFKRFGGTKRDTSEILQDMLADGIAVFQTQARRMFKVVDDLTPNPIVSYRGLKRASQDILEEAQAGLGDAAGLAKKILEKGDIVTFKEAQTLRSALLRVGRQSGPKVFDATAASKAARRLSGIVDSAMERAAQDLPKSVLKQWRIANRFWRRGVEEFNAKTVRAVAGNDPEVVFDTVIRAGRPTTIRRVRNIIVRGGKGFKGKTKSGKDTSVIAAAGRSKEWRAIQGEFFRDMMNRSTDDLGRLSGRKLLSNINKFGQESMSEMFPVGVAGKEFKELAVALQTTQAAGKETTGRVFIQLKQAGAATELLGLTMGITGISSLPIAATVFLLPAAIGRLFTNSTFAKAMTFGLKAPRGSAQAVRALTQALSAATQFGSPRSDFLLPGP